MPELPYSLEGKRIYVAGHRGMAGGAIVRRLAQAGTCEVISTHDVEFAASASHRTLLMADGELIADGSTAEVLTSSPAYAPQMAKVFAPLQILTPDEVAAGLPATISSRRGTS